MTPSLSEDSEKEIEEFRAVCIAEAVRLSFDQSLDGAESRAKMDEAEKALRSLLSTLVEKCDRLERENELLQMTIYSYVEDQETAEAELKAMRTALEPFVRYVQRELDKEIPRHIQDDPSTPVLASGSPYDDDSAVEVTVGDFMALRSALSAQKEGRDVAQDNPANKESGE